MITGQYTNEQYHALPAVSKTRLALMGISPAHCLAGFQGIGADTARIGTAVHSVILEGAKDLIVVPKMPRSSKADKQALDDWFMANGATGPIATIMKADDQYPEFERQTGLTVVNDEEMNRVECMRASVMRNELAAELLSEGIAEQSIFFEHNGVECRTRPDWMDQKRHLLVDVKSTVDASARGFARSISNYTYHIQDAMYSASYHSVTGTWPRFAFIAVEKTAPYACAVYELDEAAKEEGYRLFEKYLEMYKECLESGQWPSYDNNLSLSIPIWDKPEVIENYEELMA